MATTSDRYDGVFHGFLWYADRQAGLFTFASSPKHLGLYQAYGFWPGQLVAILGKPVSPDAEGSYALASDESGPEIRAPDGCGLRRPRHRARGGRGGGAGSRRDDARLTPPASWPESPCDTAAREARPGAESAT